MDAKIYRENDNIDLEARKKYSAMTLEELEKLMLEEEAKAFKELQKKKN